jgi:hypothetical protein
VNRRSRFGSPPAAAVAGIALILAAAGCGGSDRAGDATTAALDPAPEVDTAVEPPAFVYDVVGAIEAVEAELGPGQEFFEVTANAQFTNVFVAVDDATAAVAYAYVDGELEPPAPKQPGAEGLTFGRNDVDFDPELVVAGVSSDLPASVVDAISVYGDGVGATYVVAATSGAGGFLDIVVGPQGQVRSVNPI